MINDESDANTPNAPLNDTLGLLSENHQVDIIVNLNDLSADEAVTKVNQTINNAKGKKITKIWFSFELASGNGQTLFQPVGKALRDKIKTHEIIRAMPSNQGGWIARIK